MKATALAALSSILAGASLQALPVGLMFTPRPPRSWALPSRPSRKGWTNRRYQRHALKLRNRARHRAACKGRR